MESTIKPVKVERGANRLAHRVEYLLGGRWIIFQWTPFGIIESRINGDKQTEDPYHPEESYWIGNEKLYGFIQRQARGILLEHRDKPVQLELIPR